MIGMSGIEQGLLSIRTPGEKSGFVGASPLHKIVTTLSVECLALCECAVLRAGTQAVYTLFQTSVTNRGTDTSREILHLIRYNH